MMKKEGNRMSMPMPVPMDDAAAGGLVGGIVEKGFSDNRTMPSAPPRPTVLPFPVARHRSHGPHWAPIRGNVRVINDNEDDEDLGEEEDFTGMDKAAHVANPVQRKLKKGFDFSRWQEMSKTSAIASSSSSLLYEKKKKPHLAGSEVGHRVKQENTISRIADPHDAKVRRGSDADRAKEQLMSVDDDYASTVSEDTKVGTESTSGIASANEISSFPHAKNENDVQLVERLQDAIPKSEESIMMDMVPKLQNGLSDKIQVGPESSKTGTSGFASRDSIGGEEGSLENQIDAENRARLAEMSADEIAEAQADIMAKLNPELISALKKRGVTKVKGQKFSKSDAVTINEADGVRHEKNISEITVASDETSSVKAAKEVAEETLTDKDVIASSNPMNSSKWDAWRIRVERVRDMRFSLDGNVINTECANAPDAGKTSSQSGYNADNVTERDYLRTEGDPGAVGYTIKEAVALTRSVVPGQRTLALHLIGAVLDRAICGICQNQDGSASGVAEFQGSVDWEAVWAFALGPEPELALSLRMCLDDNHNSVVLACAKAIQCVLSCDTNEVTFNISEKTPTYWRDVCTAPVFRSKPDLNVGFLRGGFWKYNAKPSNILYVGEESVGDNSEGEHTIQDDIVVAGQDIAAGLVRMGILSRISYLLETDPAASLEECLVSILIAIARHSPTCAAAIMDCGRLVQTIANRFSSNEHMEINPCKIKSVTLLKVLARVEKKNCLIFMKNGIFHKVTWHLYRDSFSLDLWFKSGREACKLSSALLIEQLRFWKVFIRYGYCASEFSDLFASLCIWLSVPAIEKLIDNGVIQEYCAVTNELYLILDVLADGLSNFYSCMNDKLDGAAHDKETWSWSHFGPVIDLALEWIEVKNIPPLSRFFNYQTKDIENCSLRDSDVNALLWVISSALSFLSSVLKAVASDDTLGLHGGRLPWLPDFVPKLGLKIIRNGYFKFSAESDTNHMVEYLTHLRLQGRQQIAISSVCCLQGLVQVVSCVDKLIQNANLEVHNAQPKYQYLSREDKILSKGLCYSCAVEVGDLLTTFMKLMTNEWQFILQVEMFGRGGPAPGVGVGWGASCGGYWSLTALLAQQDASLLIDLLELSEIPSAKDPLTAEEMFRAMQMLNCALASCLMLGPGNSSLIDNLLKFIFKVNVLKCLNFGIHQFLVLGKGFKPFGWNYAEEEYLLFANVLAAHFNDRWLGLKKKRKAKGQADQISQKASKRDNRSLETIHEDTDAPSIVQEDLPHLRVEWAHQRLPLPAHWFLSAISTIQYEKNGCIETFVDVPSDFLSVAKAGIFFLLGIEAIPTFLTSEFPSPVKSVPVVWKLHAMSVILLSGMGILEDERSRDVYESLQNVYGEIVDKKELPKPHDNLNVGSLNFELDIHENYSTFVEALVDQFAAESYGDVLFGRQVAMYLHRSAEASVRFATWNALSNARALELLPSLENCFTEAEGYLEPIEDNERILEAYVKSWTSGALDKAASWGSMTFSLVLHHISLFVFGDVLNHMLPLRNKLAKSLLRDYSRKQQREGMMVKLICYNKANMGHQHIPSSEAASALPIHEIEKRLQLLNEICEGPNATAMQVLESCIRKNIAARHSNRELV